MAPSPSNVEVGSASDRSASFVFLFLISTPGELAEGRHRGPQRGAKADHRQAQPGPAADCHTSRSWWAEGWGLAGWSRVVGCGVGLCDWGVLRSVVTAQKQVKVFSGHPHPVTPATAKNQVAIHNHVRSLVLFSWRYVYCTQFFSSFHNKHNKI